MDRNTEIEEKTSIIPKIFYNIGILFAKGGMHRPGAEGRPVPFPCKTEEGKVAKLKRSCDSRAVRPCLDRGTELSCREPEK
jgi:hypothetical protein